MGEESSMMPHKLSLSERKTFTMTGATEVVSFDENTVVLKTNLGQLQIHGKQLQLKNLSLEGGQVAVDGHICALIYEEPRPTGGLRRLFG